MLHWTIAIEENFLFDMHLCHSLGLWHYIRDEIATCYYHTVRYRFCVGQQTGKHVVCWLQLLLPYEAETQTAQRCQAARLRARCRPVTSRRSSSSSELLLQGSWRVRTCACDCFMLRGQQTGDHQAPLRAFSGLQAACNCKGRDVTKTIEHTVR
jgi:hypothetical protein